MRYGKRKSGTKIRIWLLRKGIRQADIVQDLKIDPSAISHWIDGHISSKRIKDYFINKGCPKKLLER